MADALSQITTCLGSEAVQAILDGATIGASQRAEGEDPSVIEGDQQKEKRGMSCRWVSPSRNACHLLGCSSKRRPQTRCSFAMVGV